MRPQLAILIPTYNRPFKIDPLTANALDTTPEARIYFICEEDDAESIRTVEANKYAQLIINSRTPSYSGAINTGVLETNEPFIFAGADDINFKPGWFLFAKDMIQGNIKVVGTNDMGNPEVLAGSHATHYLVERSYAFNGVADSPGLMLFEGYDHNWTDKEFILTAQHRNAYAHCHEAIVEHHHWAWGKASMDNTYNRGVQSESSDRTTFLSRQHLWT